MQSKKELLLFNILSRLIFELNRLNPILHPNILLTRFKLLD
ncbi:hypothetical protein SALWKB2_2279 [Snodgrassella alvi wkB2]|nr:hypothetical protein SALWKB2_2279 [Snodgrassella alvi wkB2]